MHTPNRPPGRSRPLTRLEQGERGMLLILAALTLAAWILTIRQVTGGMDAGSMDDVGALVATGMGAAEWSLTGLAAFVVAWTVMMAAMMFPAAAPLLLHYHAIAQHRQTRGGAFVPTWVFAAGYLLVWMAVGAGIWILGHALSAVAGHVGVPARATWTPLILGDALIAAGLYQLTRLKEACLAHCRFPVVFITRHWQEGRWGALGMGIRHGGYCLGCCWALFAVLVAAGVMSLGWMLLLTLVVFAEKVLPCGRHVSAIAGGLLLLLGAGVLSGVVAFPWLA
jgi:predicted metal-binding membrane protein